MDMAVTKPNGKRGEYKKATERREKQQETIILWLTRSFTEAGACARAGVSYTQQKKWKREDEKYKLAVEEAKEVGTECLEDTAMSRGRRKSDVLLMFVLKKRNPEFRDKVAPSFVQPVTVVARRF